MQTDQPWSARATAAVRALFRPAAGGDPIGGTGLGGFGWQRLVGRSSEIVDVNEEVAAEQRGRVVIVGRNHLRCRALLAALRGQELTPEFTFITREGFFTLVDLSAGATGDGGAGAVDGGAGEDVSYNCGATQDCRDERERADALTIELADADLLLYLFDADERGDARRDNASGWQTSDAHWYSRLRTLGAAMLPVAVASEVQGLDTSVDVALRRQLGIAPAWVPADALFCAPEAESERPAPALGELVERMLALRPRLAMPLAQEVPFCRRMIAARVIRTGALMAALVGAEPIPLLDLPLHVAVHWKLALQVAAIYGRPGLDVRSGEMAGALSLSVAARMGAQQAVKFMPVVGWLLSSILSGVSALLLGHSLVRVYEQERLLDLRAAAQSVAQRTVQRAAQTAARAGARRHAVLNGRLRRFRRAGASAAGAQAADVTAVNGDAVDSAQAYLAQETAEETAAEAAEETAAEGSGVHPDHLPVNGTQPAKRAD